MKIGAFDVAVTARANCKRMTLRYSSIKQTFSLSIPRGTSLKTAEEFLRSKLGWMTQQAGAAQAWQPMYLPGERHMLLGRRVVLGRDVPAGTAYIRYRNEMVRRVIVQQLEYWTRRMGVTVSKVTLREMKSRWGSCKAKERKLCFNLHLAAFEPELIELTVVHELCHYAHQDHSPAFYQEMTRWLPDWQERKRRRAKADVRALPGNSLSQPGG